MKTIRLRTERPAANTPLDDVIPTGGTRLFEGLANVLFTPRQARVVGDPGLKVEALLTGDIAAGHGLYSGIPVGADGTLDARLLTPSEPFYIRVRNTSSSDQPADVGVLGIGSIDGRFPKDHFVGCAPTNVSLDEDFTQADHRIVVPARGHLTHILHLPFAAELRRIETRSRAGGRLQFGDMCLANVSLMSRNTVPVGFFAGGIDIRSYAITPASSIKLLLCNPSDVDEWVEVDLTFAPPEPPAEDVVG